MKKRKRHLTITTKYDHANNSDYDLRVTQDYTNSDVVNIEMTHGYNSDWINSIKGTYAAALTDTGDHIIIDMQSIKKNIKLEYYEFNQLYGLMKYYIEHSKLETDGIRFLFDKVQK